MHQRAPRARLVFVDYLTILPASGGCAAIPLSPAQAENGRAIARRLAALTAKVATETGSLLIAASAASREHNGCAADPWVNAFPRPDGLRFVPYHPNARGMAAIAELLAARLRPGSVF